MAQYSDGPDSIQDLLTVAKDGDAAMSYTPRHKTVRMGNAANIGFGGYTLGVLVSAACQSTPDKYALYAFHGIYMGPLLTEGAVKIVVKSIRETKSFATRLVVLSQQGKNGQYRDAFTALCDFHIAEPDVFLYSVPPRGNWPSYNDLEEYRVVLRKRVEAGDLAEQLYKMFLKGFAPSIKYFDVRYCPEGIFAQNVIGLDKDKKTTQDDLPITSKTTAIWIKTRETIQTSDPGIHQSILAFVLDMALSFMPAVFMHKSLNDYAALSSLDTSLRFHHTDFRADQFILVECVTEGAAQGRTYSMNRAWSESGQLIATNNQASIIREHPTKKASL